MADSLKEKSRERIIFFISLAVILVLIPATYLLSYLFGDRKYYIASVIITLLAMVPFFISFEGRRPDARMLAILAVMTVAAIVSRVAFIWAPSFKPMAGIIIITAMAFGSQAGFMCGALAMITSNIIFGQGPWTPWQMFCYGMIGFIAGLLAKRRVLSERHAIRSALISFCIVFVLSTIVLDTCSIFYMSSTLNSGTVLAVYIAGFPLNISNSIASGLAVFLLVKPLIRALDRMKTKYDIHY